MYPKHFLILCSLLYSHFCFAQKATQLNSDTKTQSEITVGANKTKSYLPLLTGKNVALLVNQTSVINKTSLVDSLLKLGVSIKKVFCPEHGFRGSNDAGEDVANSKDPKTGIPIVSLYGDKKKPSKADMTDIDIVAGQDRTGARRSTRRRSP